MDYKKKTGTPSFCTLIISYLARMIRNFLKINFETEEKIYI